MRDVYVIGVSTTKFGKLPDRSIKSLTAEAVEKALQDAGLKTKDIEAAWFGNAGWGAWHNQHSIKGQVALRPLGFNGLAVINVENACATASTAFHGAYTAVASGLFETALAVGVEKLYYPDKAKVFYLLGSGVDVENREELFQRMQALGRDVVAPGQEMEDSSGGGEGKSSFMDIYGGMARWHMKKYGTTQRQLAAISSKNHYHGSLNPNSQYQVVMSVEHVMADRLISWPITRAMCSPIGDGAAAADHLFQRLSEKTPGGRPGQDPGRSVGLGHGRAPG